MAREGRLFRVQILQGSSWVSIPGERASSCAISREQADSTDKDAVNKWRGLSPCGIGICELTVKGFPRDDDTAGIFSILMGLAINGGGETFRVVSNLSEVVIEGEFKATSLSRAGEHNGAETFDVTLHNISIGEEPPDPSVVSELLIFGLPLGDSFTPPEVVNVQGRRVAGWQLADSP